MSNIGKSFAQYVPNVNHELVIFYAALASSPPAQKKSPAPITTNAVGFDESFDCDKQKRLRLARLTRTFSPMDGSFHSPQLSPIDIKKSPAANGQIGGNTPVVFKKNSPTHMNAERNRRLRRLTMFKVPKSPSPVQAAAAKTEKVMKKLKSLDLNRPLCLNLILQDIGMMKYSNRFMEEEVKIFSFSLFLSVCSFYFLFLYLLLSLSLSL